MEFDVAELGMDVDGVEFDSVDWTGCRAGVDSATAKFDLVELMIVELLMIG